MNSEVGVPGVVKARYADFLVHEIAASGEVAVVRELAVRSSSKRVAESDADGAAERDVKRARSDGGVGEEAAAAESVDEARQRIAEDGIARISALEGLQHGLGSYRPYKYICMQIWLPCTLD